MYDGKGEIIAAKVIIYAEEYYTFITPEAYSALKDWMDFRISYGEKITGDSWLMRNLWQTTNQNYGARWGGVLRPIPRDCRVPRLRDCYLELYGNKEYVRRFHQA